MPDLSVVICTHNPNENRVDEVLGALRVQTFSCERWDLLVVDNASTNGVNLSAKLKWHPDARVVVEPRLGLTQARIRGIREATADVIIFVDDDNLLDPEYLSNVFQISKIWPQIGAWGGQISPRFEREPAKWTQEFWPMLAIRDVAKDLWSNVAGYGNTAPCGAGLCVRRSVAIAYSRAVAADPMRVSLDRIGAELTSCGDTDLALTACDIGLGTGQFRSLRVTHIIPPDRLTDEYLVRLIRAMKCSHAILDSIRGTPLPPADGFRTRVVRRLRLLKLPKAVRKCYLASDLGLRDARIKLRRMGCRADNK